MVDGARQIIVTGENKFPKPTTPALKEVPSVFIEWLLVGACLAGECAWAKSDRFGPAIYFSELLWLFGEGCRELHPKRPIKVNNGLFIKSQFFLKLVETCPPASRLSYNSSNSMF